MTKVQTDDDIRNVMEDCCSKCDKEELAEEIQIVFVKPEETSGEMTGARLKPELKILINKSAWMSAEDSERLIALKSEVCYVIACTVMERKVKRNGPEWRYFAFETGTIELESEPQKVESFVLLTEW